MLSAEYVVVVVAVAACVCDLRTRRIPNALTFGAPWRRPYFMPSLAGRPA